MTWYTAVWNAQDRERAMNALMKDVIIPDTGSIRIELELPEGFPVGEAVMTLQPKVLKDGHENRAAAMCGKGKGAVWMADDFDAPLDDFAEHM